MQINGIIIDGVLHELIVSNKDACEGCSLEHLCKKEFGNSCLCWINLAPEAGSPNNEFICRGKITEIKTE